MNVISSSGHIQKWCDLVLWNQGPEDLEQFLSNLDNQNAAIQFTMELENQGTLPFFNVNVEQAVNKLKFKVNRKDTQTNQYVHAQCNHSMKKKNVCDKRHS